MKIGKESVPRSAISTANEDTIVVRGLNLCDEVIGKFSFSEYFYTLLTGEKPSASTLIVLDATLVAITEHGLVPSVQAARMTYAASPEAMQGAVAAGLLGCGSVILGASADAGVLLDEVKQRIDKGSEITAAAHATVSEYREAKRPLPGYGHPLHKARDPRVAALFSTAEKAGSDLTFVKIAEAIESVIPEIYGRELKLNVSAAIPSVLLGAGFPLKALRGVPILARSAGLVAHLYEEQSSPIGFALSYQATLAFEYTGELPAGFMHFD
ncbi:citryl-CoA lyase [Pseudomonas sp. MAFF 301449]|uniref:citrate synthase (unknown stereospecificity) n=1 Tax=Pseudomonas cyclaminis TaxID=2781239 RepID=A0ABR9SSP8_9PSED|nr:citryl-CoA lyase [Pseudomonas cyclaminis]MBE8591940.1 citryl-CoA lyase [Pseudomonas cyclaminis]MBE8600137.1 citryl-CoA lyase [Pseudomonas cyclaminis]